MLPVVITLQAMGVDAIGLNCLLDPMLPLIEEVRLHTAVPIIAKPDVRSSDETLLTPESFAQKMRLLMQAGARIVGGHDDSTPEHIAALKEVVQEFGEPEIPEEPDCYASTIETEAFFLGDDIAFSEPLACTSHLADDLIDLEDDRCNTALVEVESGRRFAPCGKQRYDPPSHRRALRQCAGVGRRPAVLPGAFDRR